MTQIPPRANGRTQRARPVKTRGIGLEWSQCFPYPDNEARSWNVKSDETPRAAGSTVP